ncbi:O-antigen ligase family protein [Granulicella sp. dw_53]|uniref:O-antigen ligase family protein n=1 Tax=Granulicella sp. dw_53 TaxID=2719792 RepID=UPI001BD42FD4|nr:O-antigen ligase family protein [Granulicella sp. dw_53]
MSLVSLGGKPLYGLYYMIPFLPYRTMRDHFLDYPLGSNVLSILVLAVVIGGFIHCTERPKSKLYGIWFAFAVYLYVSMWFGTALGNAPAPLWLSDINFVTWKDYMLIPLVFLAAGLVVNDRKAVRTVILLTGFSLFAIDRSCLMESLSHSWANFDENKRSGGPLGYGSNQTAAFLAQFGMFFWGFGQFMKRIKVKLLCYALVGATILATMYTFSRGSYLALLASVFVLAILKDRKLLVILAVFLFTWQFIVPTAVQQRVNMTSNSNGRLEASAQERVDLWTAAKDSIIHSPIFGTGYATFQMGKHTDDLKDTHNWYIKVLVETGVIGIIFAALLIQQMFSVGYKLFKTATDPLYQGLGLGLLLAVVSCAVANFFGDRWTYIEITALLWLLVGAAIRAKQLTEAEAKTVPGDVDTPLRMMPQGAYR